MQFPDSLRIQGRVRLILASLSEATGETSNGMYGANQFVTVSHWLPRDNQRD